MLLATPDFGAAGSVLLLVAVCWLMLFCLVGVGIFFGIRLCRRKSLRGRIGGPLILLICFIAPLVCCIAPSELFRLRYGSYPLAVNRVVKEGMTAEEVEATLGKPHRRLVYDNGEEHWSYYNDAYGAGFYAVVFGTDKRVRLTLSN